MLADVFALQHVIELLQRVIRIQIGQEAQVAAVDTDDFNVIACQNAGCAQHIAVTADDNGEISQFTDLRQAACLCAFQG
ncbi:hypothetical protein D3C80_1976810 [compost metagenome]